MERLGEGEEGWVSRVRRGGRRFIYWGEKGKLSVMGRGKREETAIFWGDEQEVSAGKRNEKKGNCLLGRGRKALYCGERRGRKE